MSKYSNDDEFADAFDEAEVERARARERERLLLVWDLLHFTPTRREDNPASDTQISELVRHGLAIGRDREAQLRACMDEDSAKTLVRLIARRQNAGQATLRMMLALMKAGLPAPVVCRMSSDVAGSAIAELLGPSVRGLRRITTKIASGATPEWRQKWSAVRPKPPTSRQRNKPPMTFNNLCAELSALVGDEAVRLTLYEARAADGPTRCALLTAAIRKAQGLDE